MTSTKFTQALLAVIVLLLTWLAMRPYLSATPVHASTAVQYKVADIEGGVGPNALTAVEQQLNELGKDGWSLVACPNGFGPCIFKR